LKHRRHRNDRSRVRNLDPASAHTDDDEATRPRRHPRDHRVGVGDRPAFRHRPFDRGRQGRLRLVSTSHRHDQTRVIPPYDCAWKSPDSDERATHAIRIEASRGGIGVAAEADQQASCGCRRIRWRDDHRIATAEHGGLIGIRGPHDGRIDTRPLGNAG
jgi:hypothetical protein